MAVAARLIAALTSLAAPSLAAAAERPDGAFNWQMDFQNPATLVMDYIHWFSTYTLIIVTLIMVLVVGLLGWCILRFNERANPVPSRVTHNTLVEVLWTVLPVLILVAIAIPSFKLLYGEYDPSKLYPDFNPQTTKWLTLKFTGLQWAWDVSYPNGEDNATFGVTNPIVPAGELAPVFPLTALVNDFAASVGNGAGFSQKADVIWAGLSPGNLGLYQVNLQIPWRTPAGSAQISWWTQASGYTGNCFVTIGN